MDVWRYMLEVHRENESCVLTGSSTHNERVERMWRDVYRCVSSQFVDTFHREFILVCYVHMCHWFAVATMEAKIILICLYQGF